MERPPSNTIETSGDPVFAQFLPLIQAADGLTLGQVCTLAGLEPSTIQNWIKRGFVPHPIGKKYRERHIARILLIGALRGCMQIDRVGALMTYINGNADDESDDIISDVTLYDIFCRLSDSVSDTLPSREAAGEKAEEILTEYIPPSPERSRLKEALTVMAIACIAGKLKQEADRLYSEIFKEENHE